MRYKLSDFDISLLVYVVTRHRPDLLPVVNDLLNGWLSQEQREELTDILSDEVNEAGLDADGEPTPYGDQLEELIEMLGHIGPPV